eukprot:tig00000117_g6352.t1
MLDGDRNTTYSIDITAQSAGNVNGAPYEKFPTGAYAEVDPKAGSRPRAGADHGRDRERLTVHVDRDPEPLWPDALRGRIGLEPDPLIESANGKMSLPPGASVQKPLDVDHPEVVRGHLEHEFRFLRLNLKRALLFNVTYTRFACFMIIC